MHPADLAALIHAVATDVLTGRGLATAGLPAEVGLDRPKVRAHGDYCTAVALRAAPALDVPASVLAGWLADELAVRPGIASAEVAGPGFVNLRVVTRAAGDGAVSDAATVFEVPAERVVRLRGGGTRTAAELAAAVGRDTARFVLLRARPGATPVLDLATLAGATDANPAFRVRHAHTRCCALLRNADTLGIEPAPDAALDHPRELEVLDVVQRPAPAGEPDRLARHLESLTEALERFETCCPALPTGDQPPTDRHRARVALVDSARRVLADGLRRLDVSAPERM
ncbi:arginine--tRNA ligase [Pseudonocardia sp.]|uniref:arginine--tRNA ligase n=1 Tax=Pseudonocardia sp. TaxID=60912 RepID=UPI00262F9854|nr:arginine--tRNA ligase [Pseudonocardia sp.]